MWAKNIIEITGKWFLAAILLSSLLVSLFVGSVNAQIYRFKIYNTATGLSNNSVFSLLQDHKGYIWFATNNGVSRYDGQNYQVFTTEQGLPDNPVRGIVEDQQHQIWVLTRGGISRYDGATFTNYTVANGLADNEVRSGYCAHDGTLWFGTLKGLSRFDGKTFTNYTSAQGLPAGPVWAITEDKQGNLWIAIRGGGLAKLVNGQITTYGAKEGLSNSNIFDLAFDQNGSLWLAADGGVYAFTNNIFRHYTTADGLGNERISTILVDRYNRVWCGTYGGGISRLEGNRFITINRSNGLPDNYVISHLQDYEGNIWWGTQRSGAFQFRNENFTNYTEAMGLGEGVISGVAETSDGKLWFSSLSNGLSSLDTNGTIKHYHRNDGLMEDELWVVYADHKDRIWVGGHKGLSCFDGQRYINYPLADIGLTTRISSLIEDSQGNIWIGSDTATSNGIFIFDGKNFTRYSTEHGLGSNQINSFALDRKKQLWLCTENGLSHFNSDGKFITYNRDNGLSSKYIQRFYQDEQDRYWIGTSEGVTIFDINSGKAVKSFSMADGLPDNSVRAITSINGNIWIGTLRGLAVYDEKSFRKFGVKDGLISDSITIGWRTRNGSSLWFGTTEGAVHYYPGPELLIARAPQIDFTRIKIGDETFDPASKLSLAYDKNSLTIEFVGLSFVEEESIRFSYLMESFDTKWSLPDSTRFARFTNLPPGNYQFKLKAISKFGLWSEPIVLSIAIAKPFWQTWPFRGLILLLFIVTIYASYNWRIQILKMRHQQRLASLRQLLDSIQVINSRLDLNIVLQVIAAEGARLINGDPGGIGIVNDDQVTFTRLWLNDHWEEHNISFKLGEGVAGKVAAEGNAYIVNSPATDTNLLFPDLIEKYYVHGFIDVPIKNNKGKVVGVLDVRRRANQPPFTDADRQLLESLVNQAAIAIENAGLYGELEKLYKHEQEVTRTLQDLDAMKTNFMIVASHEMRTPLTILKGYHDLLLERHVNSLNAFQKRSLVTCQKTVNRLINSADNMLEMIKITEGQISLKLTNVNFNEIASVVIEELSGFIEKRQQHLILNIADKNIKVIADKDKLQLILVNLIQNAIKFTPDNGEIKLSAMVEDDQLHAMIVDNGIGIASEEIARIFEKFYTSSDTLHHTSGKYEYGARGTGLGLALVKNYVEAQKGKVWATSAGAGQGSAFHFTLPLAKD